MTSASTMREALLMMLHRRVSEFGTIGFGDGVDELPKPKALRLLEALEQSPCNRAALSLTLKGLKSAGHVGIVANGECCVEILPKIEGRTEAFARKRLIEMLAIAHDLPIDIVANAPVETQQSTWLECLIRLFGRELQKALQGGMPRAYLLREDELRVLRGRLDIIRQFTKRPYAPDKLNCRYDELCEDTPLNRVMKAVLEHLIRLTNDGGNKRLFSELLLFYPNVSSVPKRALTFDTPLDRTNNRWRLLLGWARFLLENTFQTTSHGSANGFALLFEMNFLFERFVAKLLSRELTSAGYGVRKQVKGVSCLHAPGDPNADPVCGTKPDIIISRDHKPLVIIDTKWKCLDSNASGTGYGISHGDVHQMMAYAHLYDCKRLILLYPVDLKNEISRDLLCHYAIRDMNQRILSLAAIDLSLSITDCRKALAELVFRCLELQPPAQTTSGAPSD